METSALSVLGAVACLAVSFLLLRGLMPQNGKPPSRWTSTEARSTFVSLALVILIVGGIGLLISSFVR
jgi:hypothetical protein